MRRTGTKNGTYESPILSLMFDNILVADLTTTNGTARFKVKEGLPEFFVPLDLFMWRSEITILDLAEWLEERVFPEDRMGVRKLLRSLGLKKYDPLEVALKTRACLVEDGFWIKVEEGDTFRDNTIRGKLGFKELDISNYPKAYISKGHS